MKIKNMFTPALIAVAICIALYSCKKDSSSTTSSAEDQTAVTMSASASSSELIYDDAFNVVSQSSEQSNLSTNSITGTKATVDAIGTTPLASYTTTAGAIITILPATPSVYPKIMTINFGAGVTDANGVTRKGQITVNLTGPLRVAGSTISVSFNNYAVNSYGLTGTYALIPQLTADSGVNFNITVTNGSITFPDGQISTYSATETFTQVGGLGTSSVTDDTYNITGSFAYSNTSNGSITGTISSPLVKSADCKDITSGTVAFVYKGLDGVLDFGSGTCDNIATIKVGITTKTITLPE